jgi:hypothetical protein
MGWKLNIEAQHYKCGVVGLVPGLRCCDRSF